MQCKLRVREFEKMKTIVLIGCGNKKRQVRSKACELYTGTYFKMKLAYANKLAPDSIYILSGKYGLIDINAEIDTYDVKVSKNKIENKKWAMYVFDQIKLIEKINECNFIFLAGIDYYKNIIQHINNFSIPMKEVGGIGNQQRWLKEKLNA
jgi:hypothetical protein